MAQTKAVQDQPSMEDILTSIRRIIDEGDAKSSNTSPPSADEVANDDSAVSASAATVSEAKPDSDAAEQVAKVAINEIPELDSFLEALDAKYTAQQGSTKKASDKSDSADASSGAANPPEIDASIAIIDEAMGVADDESKDSEKYDARFSDDDRDAFKAVGSALTANTVEPAASASQAPASAQRATALVSESTGFDQERAGKVVIGTLAVAGAAIIGGKFLRNNLGKLATAFRRRRLYLSSRSRSFFASNGAVHGRDHGGRWTGTSPTGWWRRSRISRRWSRWRGTRT